MGSTKPLHEHDDRSPWTRKRSPGLARPQRRPLTLSTPSPSWKATLKQGCLERARLKRQDAIWQRRRSPETARQLVEDELRESGVAIRMLPPKSSLLVDGEPVLQQAESEDLLEDYAISETEMYELMQEVEEELQRDEARFLEVMEEVELSERLNMQHIEDQIAEFEDWEASQDEAHRHDRDDLVLCPVCKDANLVHLEQQGFSCPNNMNGLCPLRLETPEENITMSNLRERLRAAFEEHACTCPCPLEFVIREGEHGTTLVAGCSFCDSNVSIL